MKPVSLALLAFVFFSLACNKDVKKNAVLLGTWVEKQYRTDTLVVYQQHGRTIMFDNCMQYRLSGRMFPDDKFFRSEIRLDGNRIGFRGTDASRREEFNYFDFEWVVYKEEFRMHYNGLRPYLSSIGYFNFVRVK